MEAAPGTTCPRTRGRRAQLALAASLVVAVLLSLVSAARAAAPAWTTYHHDPQRSGIDPDSAAAIPPELAWQTPPLDGSMSAEPLVYGSHVYAVTKNDTVYALEAATGAIAWQRHVGSAVPTGTPGLELAEGCNQVGSQVGITSTPVIDPATNAIYAVTTTWSGTRESVRHELVALDLDSGAMLPGFPIAVDPPYPPGGSAAEQLQRPALALDAGRVIIGYGSYGDCETYWGWLVSAPESGIGPLRIFQVESEPRTGVHLGLRQRALDRTRRRRVRGHRQRPLRKHVRIRRCGAEAGLEPRPARIVGTGKLGRTGPERPRSRLQQPRAAARHRPHLRGREGGQRGAAAGGRPRQRPRTPGREPLGLHQELGNRNLRRRHLPARKRKPEPAQSTSRASAKGSRRSTSAGSPRNRR